MLPFTQQSSALAHYASVAQLVERLPPKQDVCGSIPYAGAKLRDELDKEHFYVYN